MRRKSGTKIIRKESEALIEFFKQVTTHNYNEAKKEMADFISIAQKDPQSYLKERIIILYDKIIKDNFIDISKHYYSLKNIKAKSNEAPVSFVRQNRNCVL